MEPTTKTKQEKVQTALAALHSVCHDYGELPLGLRLCLVSIHLDVKLKPDGSEPFVARNYGEALENVYRHWIQGDQPHHRSNPIPKDHLLQALQTILAACEAVTGERYSPYDWKTKVPRPTGSVNMFSGLSRQFATHNHENASGSSGVRLSSEETAQIAMQCEDFLNRNFNPGVRPYHVRSFEQLQPDDDFEYGIKGCIEMDVAWKDALQPIAVWRTDPDNKPDSYRNPAFLSAALGTRDYIGKTVQYQGGSFTLVEAKILQNYLAQACVGTPALQPAGMG